MKKKKPEPEYHPGNGLELFTFEFEKKTIIHPFLVSFTRTKQYLRLY